jgi:cobaltochelatase CobS
MLDYIEYDNAQYSRFGLENESVDSLRKMVRYFKVCRNSNLSGVYIAGMKQAECIDWLLQVEPVKLTNHSVVAETTDLRTENPLEPHGFDEIGGNANGRFAANGNDPERLNPPVVNKAEALLKAVCEALDGQLKTGGSIDRTEIDAWVKSEIESQVKGLDEKYRELIDGKVTRIEIWDKKEGKRLLGIEDKQHHMFAPIFKMAQLRMNIALVGPAGSGKTHICSQIAKALQLPFEPISVGPQTSQSQLMGYMDANGNYIETAFYRAYKNGGVILLDEFDAAHPGVATCINGATANDGAGFPCGYVLRHPDCIVIIAMNTWGSGASTAYVGRQPQDKATMNRFAFVEFNYDEKLERELCENKEWCEWVQRARKSLFKLGAEGKEGVRHIISPRASYAGAKMINAGMSREFVEHAVVWQGLAKSEVAKILAGMA